MILKDVLERTTKFFKEKNFDSPRLDAEILLAKGLGLKRIDLYLKFDQPLSEADLNVCRDLVQRRTKGEPIAYILGMKEFYNLEFVVTPSVLIPRPETELLVEEVLNWVKAKKNSKEQDQQLAPPNLKILDLGTGTGCLGLSILHQLPTAQAVLVDISQEALEIAKVNAERLSLSERVQFVHADAGNFDFRKCASSLWQGSLDQFDIIVGNPPYIDEADLRVQKEVREFEPALALFSNEAGLGHLKSWFKNILAQNLAKGMVGFEFGIDQTEMVKNLFQQSGAFSPIKIIKDYSGIDRHVIAESLSLK